jgi:hypothetical protein
MGEGKLSAPVRRGSAGYRMSADAADQHLLARREMRGSPWSCAVSPRRCGGRRRVSDLACSVHHLDQGQYVVSDRNRAGPDFVAISTRRGGVWVLPTSSMALGPRACPLRAVRAVRADRSGQPRPRPEFGLKPWCGTQADGRHVLGAAACETPVGWQRSRMAEEPAGCWITWPVLPTGVAPCPRVAVTDVSNCLDRG